MCDVLSMFVDVYYVEMVLFIFVKMKFVNKVVFG